MTAAPRPRRSALKRPARDTFHFRLYVAGSSDRSMRAIRNARRICDEHLAGRYELEVIDIFQQTERARDDQVIAVPVLIKRRPLPLKRIIGDLSDHDGVLRGLGVPGSPA